ncbi:hypothetical protein M0Q50_10090 [bacterium]|jgi:hypothetical protein|nr:hypothetical protein [bacterium]
MGINTYRRTRKIIEDDITINKSIILKYLNKKYHNLIEKISCVSYGINTSTSEKHILCRFIINNTEVDDIVMLDEYFNKIRLEKLESLNL